MANISKIKVNNVDYDIKDSDARSRVSTLESKVTSVTSAMHFVGITTTALTDGAATSTLAGDGLTKTSDFEKGDFVIYNNSEFVWNGSKWNELGSTGSLKKLAFKDEATGSIDLRLSGGSTTAGTAASFTQGSKAALTMSVTEETLKIVFTPNGNDIFVANKPTTVTLPTSASGSVTVK